MLCERTPGCVVARYTPGACTPLGFGFPVAGWGVGPWMQSVWPPSTPLPVRAADGRRPFDVYRGASSGQPATRISQETFLTMMDVNVNSVFFLTQAVASVPCRLRMRYSAVTATIPRLDR